MASYVSPVAQCSKQHGTPILVQQPQPLHTSNTSYMERLGVAMNSLNSSLPSFDAKRMRRAFCEVESPRNTGKDKRL